jgi:hypothetical protein
MRFEIGGNKMKKNEPFEDLRCHKMIVDCILKDKIEKCNLPTMSFIRLSSFQP